MTVAFSAGPFDCAKMKLYIAAVAGENSMEFFDTWLRSPTISLACGLAISLVMVPISVYFTRAEGSWSSGRFKRSVMAEIADVGMIIHSYQTGRAVFYLSHHIVMSILVFCSSFFIALAAMTSNRSGLWGADGTFNFFGAFVMVLFASGLFISFSRLHQIHNIASVAFEPLRAIDKIEQRIRRPRKGLVTAQEIDDLRALIAVLRELVLPYVEYDKLQTAFLQTAVNIGAEGKSRP